MKQRRMTLIVLGIFILLLIGFIWGNSLQPAAVSNEISGFARKVINTVFETVGIDELTGDGAVSYTHLVDYDGDGLLRRISNDIT